jgi:hypothetical protein
MWPLYRPLEAFAARKVAVVPQDIVIGEALVQHPVAFGFGHGCELRRFDISQADEFHVAPFRNSIFIQ